ncbi:MAG TPA: D-erythronate dehydrogenase [Vicinamibacterales bacterium]|nr:D-erythronate dehydrogenase [Vicinamibacterales bacterium]
MTVLVTGAAGFLGSRVVRALLGGGDRLPPVSRIVAADTTACPIGDPRVDVRTGTIVDSAFISSIVEDGVDLVFHLAAVLSGQSEAEFDVGMRVNVDATRGLLEACRRLRRPPRFVFASTVAVFGANLPAEVPEDHVLRPQSSYGVAKAIAELLVSEYSRRGFVDGIVLRLATVTVRPGAPNSALSSFVSGIIREPLAGIDAVCPVPLDMPIWISSPDVVTGNLIHAARVPSSALGGARCVNLPGLSVTPAQMLASLERAGGAAARARVRCEIDPGVARVVATWPGALDDRRARQLGFSADRDVDEVVTQYLNSARTR